MDESGSYWGSRGLKGRLGQWLWILSVAAPVRSPSVGHLPNQSVPQGEAETWPCAVAASFYFLLLLVKSCALVFIESEKIIKMCLLSCSLRKRSWRLGDLACHGHGEGT